VNDKDLGATYFISPAHGYIDTATLAVYPGRHLHPVIEGIGSVSGGKAIVITVVGAFLVHQCLTGQGDYRRRANTVGGLFYSFSGNIFSG
jgi:hypothetical protein